jgi:AcrR family transcriptional regulator
VSDDDELPQPLARLWGPEARSAREPRLSLTLDRILEAAIELADGDGLDAVTMARVAKRLGFTTMSLYRYVDSKDELLVLMLNHVLTPPPALDAPSDGWRHGLERWCWEMRLGLRRHPWVERVPVGGLMGTPSQLTWMDRGLGAMADTGLGEQEKAEILLLLNGYVYWEARLSADLAEAERDAGGSSPDQFAALLDRVVTADRYPAIKRALDAGIFEDGVGDDRDTDFAFGLARVLDGIERLIAERSGSVGE